MLVIANVLKRPPIRMGLVELLASASVIVGDGMVGTTLTPAMWNGGDKSANITLSNGNLTATASSTAAGAVRADQFRDTGKWYFEVDVAVATGGAGTSIGLADGSVALSSISSGIVDSIMWAASGTLFRDGSAYASMGALVGGVIRICYDADAKLVWFTSDNNPWNDDTLADPQFGLGGIDVSGFDTSGLFPAWAVSQSGDECTANFAGPFAFPRPHGFYPWIGGSFASVSGTGALHAGAASVDGAGSSSATGTGALVASAASVDGTGIVGQVGHLVAGNCTVVGSGSSSSTGAGALAAGSSDVDGSGTVSSGVTTSYANSGGTGNRTSLITVTYTGAFGGGSGSNLINGSTSGNDSGNSCWFSGQSNTTLYFDFAPTSHKQYIDEFKWYQQNTSTHGNWVVEGWDGNGGWTEVKSSFTLGGATTQTVAFDSSGQFIMYRLRQVSGSTSSSPWLYEIEFKIAQGDAFASSTTSYSNTGGNGNRSSIITVTTDLALGSGSIQNLVDGNNNTAQMFFNSGQSGKQIKFDFASGHTPVIDEFKWYQGNTSNHGTWQFQGSNDDSTYDDLGVPFILDGVASFGARTYTNPANNRKGYRYYKLKQLAGTTSASPDEAEIDFKIAGY